MTSHASNVPDVSFVIPSYNVEDYIVRCLESVKHQRGLSFEAIVINDASTDNTERLIKDTVGDDERFKVVSKKNNEGLHLARKTGAALTEGRYVYFLDGDDELVPNFCELISAPKFDSGADIYRLGMKIVPDGETDPSTIPALDAMYNSAEGGARGIEILQRAFSDALPVRDTWSVVACLYAGDFCRESFEQMTSTRLDYFEDCYEFFVLASRAKRLENITELRAFNYHYGAGMTGQGVLPVTRFAWDVNAIHIMVEELDRYLASHPELSSYSSWISKQCLEMIRWDWMTRVSLSNQAKAIEAIADIWGVSAAEYVLLDPLIGRAIWVLDASAPEDEMFSEWSLAFDLLQRREKIDARSDKVDSTKEDEYRDFQRQIIALKEAEQARLTIAREKEDDERRDRIKRDSRLLRRLFNHFFPYGSRRRRILSAAAREARS